MKINTTNYSNYNLYKTPYSNKCSTTPAFQGLKQKNIVKSSPVSKCIQYLKDFIKNAKTSILGTPLSVEDAIKEISSKVNIKFLSSNLEKYNLDKNPLVAQTVYNDILNLLNAGYSDTDTCDIITKLSFSKETPSTYKYDAAPANTAINNCKFLTNLKFLHPINYLILAYDEYEHKFYPEIFDTVTELSLKGDLTRVTITTLIKECYSLGKPNLDLINIIPKLYYIDYSLRGTFVILQKLNASSSHPPDKLLINSVIRKLPQKDIRDPYGYINQRLLCSRDYTTNENFATLNKEKFDLFNKLYKSRDPETMYRKDCSHLRSIVDFCFDSNVDKELNNECTKFFLKAVQNSEAELSDLDDICSSIKNCRSMALFGLMNDLFDSGLIDSLAHIVKNLSECKPLNEDLIKLFKDFQEKHSVIHDELKISKIIPHCSNPQKREYAEANIEDENLLFYLEKCFLSSDAKANMQRVQFTKNLLEEGFYENTLSRFFNQFDFSEEDLPFLSETMIALKKDKLKQGHILEIIDMIECDEYQEAKQKVDTLMYIRNEALKKKSVLAAAGEELTDEAIDDVILNTPQTTLEIYELLGEKAFFEMFKDKIDCLEDYLDMIVIDDNQKLMEVINPKNSQKYLELEENIKKAKKELKTTLNKQDVINKINTFTHKKNQMIKDSIKDPQEALSLVLVYSALGDKCSEIEPVMAQRTPEEKEEYLKILNNLIFEVLEIETPSSKTLEKLDFKTSRYLSKLFSTGDDVKENFESLVEVLETEPEKSTLEALNTLEQNIDTKKQFEKLGINYEKWSEFDPNSFYKVRVKTDLERMKQSAVRNLETDLNDDLFKKLPQNVKKEIVDTLNSIGIQLKEIDTAQYEGDGFMNGTNKTLRLFKDNKPIAFDDMKEIINKLKNVISESDFWNSKQENEQVENARETLKSHILKLRYNEVKNALDKKAEQAIDLQVQKTDMNNISHALFLGNHASCCTAIGSGCNEWTAPNYIKNKCISSIEITDGNSFVGNTMCYIAKVDGETSLILDNIEMKPKYQFNDNIRDAIIAYSKQLCAEIGKPDMPIYAGPNRHKVNLDMFELKERNVKIVGSTRDDEIYLDFDACKHKVDPDDVFKISMYKLVLKLIRG